MTLPIDTDRRRADNYRRRAIELAQEARWEADKGRRRFLLDKARSSVAAADEIAPELPSELAGRDATPSPVLRSARERRQGRAQRRRRNFPALSPACRCS